MKVLLQRYELTFTYRPADDDTDPDDATLAKLNDALEDRVDVDLLVRAIQEKISEDDDLRGVKVAASAF